MSDILPEKTTKTPQEKEKLFLSLVDMFVDVMDPDIIQMVLQNRSWDLNSALEDIMILSNNFPNKKNDNLMKPNAGQDYRNNSIVSSPNRGKKIPNMQNSTVTNQVNKKFSPKPKYQETNKSTHSKTSDTKSPKFNTFLDQYNYIKSQSSAYERTLMLIREGVKLMVVLRGPSGIGKSFLAKQILNETCSDMPNYKRHIFSSDDFFMTNHVYIFNPDLLPNAHSWNQRNVSKAIKDQVSPIIVDNTNTQAWEMRAYADMAVAAGYDLEIVEPDSIGTIRESELAKRNVHGVPKAKIRNMIDRYERNITPQYLLTHFQIRYSPPNMPPQPTRASKWKDKLSNHKNNKPKKKMLDGSEEHTVVSNSYANNVGSTKESLQFPNHDLHQNSPSSSFQRESVVNDEYLHFNGISKQNHNSPSYSGKKYQTNMNNHQEIQYPGDFHNLFKSTTKVIHEKDLNEYTELDRFLTTPIQKNDFKVNLRNGDIQGLTTAKESESEESINKSDIISPHSDWMAGNHKFLSANGSSVSVSKEAKKESPEHDFSIKNSNGVDKREGVLNEKSKINISAEKSVEVERENVKCGNLSVENEQVKSDMAEQGKSTFISGMVDYLEDGLSLDCSLLNSHSFSPTMSLNDLEGNLAEILPPVESGKIINHDIDNETHSKVLLSFDEDESKTLKNIELSQVLNSQSFSPTISLNDLEGNDLAEILSPVESGKIINHDLDNETNSKVLVGFDEDESKTLKNIELSQVFSTLTNPGARTREVVDEDVTKHQVSFEIDHELVSEETKQRNKEGLLNAYLDKVANDIWSLLPESNSVSNSFGKSSTNFEVPASESWNTHHKHNTVKENIKSESSYPKPPRNLLRQKANSNPQDQETIKSPDCCSMWDTVPNPLEQWARKEETEIKEQRPLKNDEILPQRVKSSQNICDSSTNTNYLDFLSLSSHSNPSGVKVLMGNPRSITDFVSSFKTEMPSKLLLDKGTMTEEETTNHSENIDISQINVLFPHLPKKCILEMVDKCQGNVDWAVDLLLDSEHSVFMEDCEESEESSDEEEEVPKSIEEQTVPPEPECARNNCEEQKELKKKIEASVVFNRSHYSDQVLKVIKRKRPEYLSMIENNQTDGSKSLSKAAEEEKKIDESDEEFEDLSTSSSECDTDNEKEFMEFIVNNDLLLQLRQKFGNSGLPWTMNVTPVVKIPVSLGRQLHGYIMDSIQSDMDQQQDIIEDTIMRDEEIAKLLQYNEDLSLEPQLQEIMDMEFALAMHKADQEELHDKNKNTVAARLSQNILFEKFPQVDCKVLVDMLKAHNCSLHDTIASLNLALDQPAQSGASYQPTPQTPAQPLSPVSEGTSEPANDLLEEAQSHRDQAATYYSLRSDCLNKAHEAFRSGNKAVATYYSQMAQVHKKKVDVCNSRAAACLLSTHKKGNTLDLHFLHVMEAEVVLDMFLDEIISDIAQQARRHCTVFIITGRGLRSRGGISRIKPMVLRKLLNRRLQYNEVNPGMLSVLIQGNSTLSHNN